VSPTVTVQCVELPTTGCSVLSQATAVPVCRSSTSTCTVLLADPAAPLNWTATGSWARAAFAEAVTKATSTQAEPSVDVQLAVCQPAGRLAAVSTVKVPGKSVPPSADSASTVQSISLPY
jgi:hypothetical protein